MKSKWRKKYCLPNHIRIIRNYEAVYKNLYCYSLLQKSYSLFRVRHDKDMDLVYMRGEYIPFNETGFVGENFIRENSVIAIPYLTLLCIFTLSGCIGNTMVIGAVLTHKVILFN